MTKTEARKTLNIALQAMARIESENKNFTYDFIWRDYDRQRQQAIKILERKK